MNHTSRSWTATEAGYGQVERESNGTLAGMHMNKMYVLGTHTQVVTDHKPLLPLYNSPSKYKRIRVDRHRTKLLAFDYLTDIQRQREEYEVIYGMRGNAECHITSILRAGVEYLFYFMTNSRYIFVTK